MKLFRATVGGSDRFRRNLKRFAAANVIAQLIGVSSLPILTRIYSPAEFGVLTAFTMVQSVCLAVSTLRFDWMIPNARSPRQADRLSAAGLFAAISVSVLLLGAVVSIHGRLEGWELASSSPVILMSLPLGVFTGSVILLLQARNVRMGDLSPISRAKLVQAVATLLLGIAFGLLGFQQSGLVAAYVCGFGLALVVMTKDLRAVVLSVASTTMRELARVTRAYGRQLASSVGLSLVNITMTSSPILLLMFFYDAVVVGWYGLIFRIATAPIGFVTTALVQSFWTDAADLVRRDPRALLRFYLGTVRRLAIIAVPFGAICMLAPSYLPPILGEEDWSGAGLLLVAITPYLVGMIVFSPTTHLVVYRKAHWQLLIDAATLVACCAVFGLLATLDCEAWVALLAASVVMFIGYLARFYAHLHANRKLCERIGV